MKQYELEQARLNAGRSAVHQPEPEIYRTDIDMESVEPRPPLPHDYDREHQEQVIKRLQPLATAGVADGGGFFNQRIWMYAMAELEEFDGRERIKKGPEARSVR